MKTTPRSLAHGRAGEDAAARLLAGKGLTIVARNYRVQGGELDLICLDGETVVFVEVKTRAAGSLTRPEQAVTTTKRRRMIRTAARFLSERDWWERPCRFDVVAVIIHDGPPTTTHWPNAFSLDEAGNPGTFYQPG